MQTKTITNNKSIFEDKTAEGLVFGIPMLNKSIKMLGNAYLTTSQHIETYNMAIVAREILKAKSRQLFS